MHLGGFGSFVARFRALDLIGFVVRAGLAAVWLESGAVKVGDVLPRGVAPADGWLGVRAPQVETVDTQGRT